MVRVVKWDLNFDDGRKTAICAKSYCKMILFVFPSIVVPTFIFLQKN
ncbi:hypothetical protein LEP1GSC013_1232 [Leptospira interrogans serovar Valbuzzi str. Duyster]|nr:hypothetical protein LEP1GSC013_1232 [Leptospira interrogans serovar Valbuzzi str. Duyster]ENO72394.1 hypothetical protein LEP1GSC012_1156 [Leptospira interrogans serovar Valbuzzi str. Valbuzzi]